MDTVRALRLCHAAPAVLIVMCLAVAGAYSASRREHDTRRESHAPPLGNIEEPGERTTVRSAFKVRGWAGDERGIRAVRVFVDGTFVALGEFAWDRPDVSTAYPHFKHGTDRHGWEATVETIPGPHTIRVEAVDIDGTSTDLGTRRVVVADSGS